MARKRFNPAERAVIAAAGIGGRVEWRNVTQWHPATVAGGIITDDDGWQYVQLVNLAETRTLGKDQVIHASPGHIRAAGGGEPSLHELRLQAAREHSPAVQDGPYAYFDRDSWYM